MECHGFQHANASVPPFKLFKTDCISISVPWKEDSDWRTFMEILSGRPHIPSMKVLGSVGVVERGGFRNMRAIFRAARVRDVLMHYGVSPHDIARIANEAGTGENRPYGELAGTHRVLLGLLAAASKGSQIIVYSTCALDPLGIQKVSEAARALRTHAATLDVIPQCNAHDYHLYSVSERLIYVT